MDAPTLAALLQLQADRNLLSMEMPALKQAFHVAGSER